VADGFLYSVIANISCEKYPVYCLRLTSFSHYFCIFIIVLYLYFY